MRTSVRYALGAVILAGAAIFADARFGTFNGAAAGLLGPKFVGGFNTGVPIKDSNVASTAGTNPDQ